MVLIALVFHRFSYVFIYILAVTEFQYNNWKNKAEILEYLGVSRGGGGGGGIAVRNFGPGGFSPGFFPLL